MIENKLIILENYWEKVINAMIKNMTSEKDKKKKAREKELI